MKKVFGIFMISCIWLAPVSLAQSPTVSISGYIQVAFTEEFDSNDNGNVDPSTFEIERVSIKFRGDVTETVRYKLAIDPGEADGSMLRDVYLAIKVFPKHELLVGQQKTQFGYENLVSASRLYFVDRAEVIEDQARGTTVRDIGIGLIGKFALSENWDFEEGITVVNGAGMNVNEDNTPKKNTWGRFGIRYKSSTVLWRFGISGGIGDITNDGKDPDDPDDDIFIDITRSGADMQFENEWLRFVTEYVTGTDDRPGRDLREESGYYVNLIGKTSYQMGPTFRHETVGRKQLGRNTVGAYYGKPSDNFRVLVNYESRATEEGDDRIFLLAQGSF